jgi:hypothetical protein
VLLGRLAGGHRDPEIHRGRPADVAEALAAEDVEEEGTLARVRLAHALDVLFVSPGDDRGALHELLRRRADVRPKVAKGGDQLGIARRKAAAEAGHRGPLRQRVEDEDVGQVGKLERRRGWLGEPELAVRLVAREDEPVLACERRESLEQGEWCNRAGRVVRRVQPDERGALPRLVRDGIQLREEPAALEERELDHPRSGECGPTPRNRVAGLRHDDGVAPAVHVEHDLREREDRLLRAERGDHVPLGIELDAEASPDPCGDRLAELGKPGRRRVAHALADAVAERLQDQGVGRLARVAHAEVDHLEPSCPARGRRLVEADERVGRLGAECGGERHAVTVDGRAESARRFPLDHQTTLRSPSATLRSAA